MPTAQAREIEEGWEIVFTIPIESVEAIWGIHAQSGGSFTANFYSCGDMTPAPHYAAWNSVDTETPDFHRPEFFGKILIA